MLWNWKPILSQKCFSKEHLKAIPTIPVNHSQKYSLSLCFFLQQDICLCQVTMFCLQKRPHTLSLLIMIDSWLQILIFLYIKISPQFYKNKQFIMEMDPCWFSFSAQHRTSFENGTSPMPNGHGRTTYSGALIHSLSTGKELWQCPPVWQQL